MSDITRDPVINLSAIYRCQKDKADTILSTREAKHNVFYNNMEEGNIFVYIIYMFEYMYL